MYVCRFASYKCLMRHVCLTCALYVPHVCICASCVSLVCLMCASCLPHVCLMCALYVPHMCLICASCLSHVTYLLQQSVCEGHQTLRKDANIIDNSDASVSMSVSVKDTFLLMLTGSALMIESTGLQSIIDTMTEFFNLYEDEEEQVCVCVCVCVCVYLREILSVSVSVWMCVCVCDRASVCV